MEYEVRVVERVVLPKGEPIFSDLATRVTIDDEAGGEYIKVWQNESTVKIDPEEWPIIKSTIDVMIEECRIS